MSPNDTFRPFTERSDVVSAFYVVKIGKMAKIGFLVSVCYTVVADAVNMYF